MKFSEHWLREWVNPALSSDALCEQLTMAGLEVESLTPAAASFTDVIVGQVLTVAKHPEADRLHLCEVNVGAAKPLPIVCGAKNVYAGMKVPVAIVGAKLPNNLTIKEAKLRGSVSLGMLCSAVELGLQEVSDGIVDLPADAPIGENIRKYLNLDDNIIDLSITPNRGDCLSIRGVAREVAALNQVPVTSPEINPIPAGSAVNFPITVQAKKDCPRYVGRVITGIRTGVTSPLWLQERLWRSGHRSIGPVVDVTNYVMLELGQPMHAFDHDKLAGGIVVRQSQAGEVLTLLDNQQITLDAETLIIADQTKPVAVAGVMGGLDSSVTVGTTNIFLESALFNATTITKQSRRYSLNSDSSYRFERGIDNAIQSLAIERATKLLLDIVGGTAGPITEVTHAEFITKPAAITLRLERIKKILGIAVSATDVEAILQRLGFTVQSQGANWQVTVPSHRADISIEEDLIEEIARLFGYDNVPTLAPVATLQMAPRPEEKIRVAAFRRVLVDLGYHEAITYSFVDKKLQKLLDPNHEPKALANPITTEMGVMRTNLWPGLINALLHNQNRQQSRVRLFELGLRFIEEQGVLQQQRILAGLAWGDAFPHLWSAPQREVDFFDVKGDLQHLFALAIANQPVVFKPSSHPALHPGRAAEITRNGENLGVIGAIHPEILQTLKIDGQVYVFELFLDELEKTAVPHGAEISKFPEIRRDIAIIVDQSIPAQQIQDTIGAHAGEWWRAIDLFDVYQGKGVALGKKSLALALTLQHPSRTLVDEEVIEIMKRVITTLQQQFSAELRG